jgi:4-azaleucine resistance transporter AzlC
LTISFWQGWVTDAGREHFAGASQFMAINLIAEGSIFLEIVIATFLLNFRHILMSASLAPKLTGVPKWRMRGLAFWITDESFAVASSLPGQLSGRFLFGLQISSYAAWATGTIIGYLVGAALPESLQNAMGIALYALFTALLIGRAKKQKILLILALLSGGLNLVFSKVLGIPMGWSFVLAMMIAAVVGVLLGFEVKDES